MSNDSRIEFATRDYVGATLTGEQIALLVKKTSPNWNGGVYPSDVAYMRTSAGLVPRGKTAYGDGVLEYIGSNAFKVLPTEQIVRKARSGRGRGTTAPKSEETILAELAAVKAKLPQVAPAAQKQPSQRKDGGVSA